LWNTRAAYLFQTSILYESLLSSENQLGWSGDNPDSKPGYCALVVDETQDLGTQALKLLRAMIPEGANDLFFVGDGY
jgi:hypothetical protein